LAIRVFLIAFFITKINTCKDFIILFDANISRQQLQFKHHNTNKMLKRIWNYISNRHINDKMDRLEALQAKIINQFTFLLALFFIINSVHDVIFGITSSYFLLLIGIALIISFFFEKIRFNSYIIFGACLTIILIVFYYSSKNGFDNGLTFYYFPLLISSLLILDKNKQYKFAIITYLFVYIFFYVGHIYDFQLIKSNNPVDIHFTKTVRIITFTQVFILLALTGYLILNKQKHITKLYKQIERSEKIITRIKKRQYLPSKISIEEVVKAAMDNELSFLPSFQQLYPYFQENLTLAYPNVIITADQYKFCALLKLGFSTKDIAFSNNISIRTVQTKKSRLRKNFNIPPDIDLYFWIDNF